MPQKSIFDLFGKKLPARMVTVNLRHAKVLQSDEKNKMTTKNELDCILIFLQKQNFRMVDQQQLSTVRYLKVTGISNAATSSRSSKISSI